MTNTTTTTNTFTKIKEIAPGCFRLRVPFHFLGLIDVGTHMTFLKLSSGKFLTLSTVDLDPEAKAEVDTLTQNGSLIEAVVATNPFHTLAFEAFYAAYGKGKDVKFYGTPRHLRKYPGIPWAGSVEDEKILKLWEKDVDLRIPLDDAFKVSENPGFVSQLFGARHNEISFHASLLGPAINKTPTAPREFHDWVLQLVKDWDFENMGTCHGGVMIGGAKAELVKCLEKNKRL
ncbi:hypothetical protein BCR33DRAFT_745391 [Rhizoclosmatium globosum]|uniref:Metallo-beta-lactamase domain-containing protein n=1 Tax=Rhizoclosmatium globosum TaxID=329046 RepID=A0A1Y2B2M8_9FUNG|nr:hypothetical protein BCR33DRAFT_745391 [Rhizoclosmatium globosum]|eukprot:ORY29079.1 hypothetical protein BCR33DRAFT_745391 [Rhizoclosmatium globosum]